MNNIADTPRPVRYYAYGPALGRMRLLRTDGEWITDEAEAIREARDLPNAANLTREEGPHSKPTVTVIWERNPGPNMDAYRLAQVQLILGKHFPHIPVSKIGVVAVEITEALS